MKFFNIYLAMLTYEVVQAPGEYYEYGSCNGVRDDVLMPSCDQCVDACANIFTEPFCTYDSVNKGAYVCTC
ncbi:hypothetical protein MKX01_039212 [Papaver californicum]|nr:hypothetical protein MKX01_039212 [Papaver californicum]